MTAATQSQIDAIFNQVVQYNQQYDTSKPLFFDTETTGGGRNDQIIVTKSNWLIANTVATPIALLKASASLTVSMSIQRPNNTGSLITVFMTKPPMAKANLTI